MDRAITVFNPTKQMRTILWIIVPYIAFGVVIAANYIAGNDFTPLVRLRGSNCGSNVGFFMAKKTHRNPDDICGLGNACHVYRTFTTGKTATYAFLSGGLFCSIMWPSIFSLAIAGLGKYTAQGSAFLIMMILGGAIIPPLQGKMADLPAIGIHHSYVIPVLCFAYLTFYAFRVKSVLKSQGIDFSALEGGGGH